MKRLFPIVCLFLMFFTATTVFAGKDDPDDPNKSPTVTSPKGGESWKTGATQTIKWSKGSGFNFVKIQLLKSNKHYKWITKKTKNDGKHVWKVPASVATGSAYKIKITSFATKAVTDPSNNNFTITKSSAKPGGPTKLGPLISRYPGKEYRSGRF